MIPEVFAETIGGKVVVLGELAADFTPLGAQAESLARACAEVLNDAADTFALNAAENAVDAADRSDRRAAVQFMDEAERLRKRVAELTAGG